MAQASEATRYPILDGHNDTLLSLHDRARGLGRSFFEDSGIGHIDLPRARRGGFAGGFFAIFVPNPEPAGGTHGDGGAASFALGSLPEPVEHELALTTSLAMAAILFRIARESDGAVRVVHTAEEIEACLRADVIAAILHCEGAEAIDPALDSLYVLYEAGLRSLGLAWSRPNRFAHGVPFDFPGSPDTGPGLTDEGKALVAACNDLKVLIDLSHLTERGFWDVAEISSAPLVATHSNAHALCPSPRNLTDRQLDTIAETGGVVGINFHRGFLRSDGLGDVETSLAEIVAHARYVVDRIGVEHVALGSDFDGARMPDDLPDAAALPRLVDALEDAGFDDGELQKITHLNWIRVLRDTWGS